MKAVRFCAALSLAIVLSFTAACSTTPPPSDDGEKTNNQISIWSTYSTAKVLKDPAYNLNNVQLEAKLDVAAANGEAESGQIIVTTRDKAVSEFTVDVSDLTNADGDVYSASNVEVFNQFYSKVDMKSFHQTLNEDYFPEHNADEKYSGYTPDALIPQKYSIQAKENHIETNANQGITFDFNVPSGTPAGEYTGAFALKLDGASYSIPVKLTVWEYDVSHVHGINLWDIAGGYEAAGEMSADSASLYGYYYDALLKYKLSAYHFVGWADDEKSWVQELRTHWAHPSFSGVFLPDMGGNRSRIYRYFKEIAQACIEDEINYFSKIRFYHQTVDEPHDKPGMLATALTVVNSTTSILKDISIELKNGILEKCDGFLELETDLQAEILNSVEFMPQCVTTYYTATDALHGIVSAFTPGIKHYETDWSKRMYEYNAEITNGEQWFYTSLFPENPRPNYRVDDFTLAGRIQGWMKKDWNVTGYLNWMCNMMFGMKGTGSNLGLESRVIDPYENPLRFNQDNRIFSNGDGYLFYPMAKYHADSPIPSVRLLSARDGQEDYDTLWELQEQYSKLAGADGYNVGSDYAVANLEETMQMYYEMLYSGLIYKTNDANFERVRRAVGGLTDAAFNSSKTMVMQTSANDGANSMLKIYSQATELYVNNKKLTKVGDYYPYSAALNNGRNTVTIKYVMDGVTRSFEYILANKTIAYDMSAMTSATQPSKGNSTLTLEDNTLKLNVESYGSTQIDLKMTDLHFTLPFGFDYSAVHNLNLTFKNTCDQTLDIYLYLKGSKGLVQVDRIAVFAYETYRYSFNYLYEKVLESDMDVEGIVLEFPNFKTDANGLAVALPKRTLEITDISYSLK